MPTKWPQRQGLGESFVPVLGSQKAKKFLGILAADIGNQSVEPVTPVGEPTAGNISADNIAENATEILMPGVRKKRP